MYDYFMEQVPPNIVVATGQTKGAAAGYLSNIVNHYANQGWEFYSVETIGMIEQPGCGCLASFFGQSPQHTSTYVVVFRKPKATKPVASQV